MMFSCLPLEISHGKGKKRKGKGGRRTGSVEGV